MPCNCIVAEKLGSSKPATFAPITDLRTFSMGAVDSSRTDFLTQVLTSSFPNTSAKRFRFADGEVGAVYTMGRHPHSKLPHPILLFVASFPPSYQGTTHHFGLVFTEKLVTNASEAATLLAQFTYEEAARYRASCLV